MLRRQLLALLALVLLHSPAMAQNAPLRIGTVQDMSGPSRAIGSEIARGMQLWVEDANARGGILGRRIELIIADSGGRMDASVNLLRRLVEQDKAEVLAAVCCRIPPRILEDIGRNVPVLYPLGSPAPTMPSWAGFSPEYVDRLLLTGRQALPPRPTIDRPGYPIFRQLAQRAGGEPPVSATLFGFTVMQAVGQALQTADSARPTPAALNRIPPARVPYAPYYEVSNPPPCNSGECRPSTCTPSVNPCPCQASPCN